jgi:hypothetical protein
MTQMGADESLIVRVMVARVEIVHERNFAPIQSRWDWASNAGWWPDTSLMACPFSLDAARCSRALIA